MPTRHSTLVLSRSQTHLIFLEDRFGTGNWLKLKGFATVRLSDGTMHEAEVHWYEAEGFGRRWAKIK